MLVKLFVQLLHHGIKAPILVIEVEQGIIGTRCGNMVPDELFAHDFMHKTCILKCLV